LILVSLRLCVEFGVDCLNVCFEGVVFFVEFGDVSGEGGVGLFDFLVIAFSLLLVFCSSCVSLVSVASECLAMASSTAWLTRVWR
jgi:hypothetical protein